MAVLLIIVLGSVLVTPLTLWAAKPLQNIVPYVPHLAAGCLLAMALQTTREPRWLRRYRMLPARGVMLSFLALAALVVARSEEHTSELQSLMRLSYAVFCLKK